MLLEAFRTVHRGETMRATQLLHNLGQSIWLDNITRGLLTGGALGRYIEEFSVTGLTSNPTIFEHAIKNSRDYDDAIRRRLANGKSGEDLFFELALEDLTPRRRPVPPDLRTDERTWTAGCRSRSRRSSRMTPRARVARGQGTSRPGRAAQPLHQDPRHARGSPRHRRGDLRRRAGQRDPALLPRALRRRRRGVPARHRAAARRGPETRRRLRGFRVHQPLGRRGHGTRSRARCAISSGSPSPSARTRRTAPCWPRRAGSAIYNAGARPQRLLWASTGTKDPTASDILYVEALAAPFTVDTIPERTLIAFADHGKISSILPPDGGDCEEVLARFTQTRCRCQRARRVSPGRRSQILCGIVALADEGDCVQDCRRRDRGLKRRHNARHSR